MELYLNQIKRLYDQLTAKSIIIPEKVIFAWVLNNLTSEYETLITTITQSIRVNGADSIKLHDLFSNLIDESKRIKNKQIHDNELALYTEYKTYKSNKANKSNKSKFNEKNKIKKTKNDKLLKCDHCHKKGHKINKC